VIPDPSAFTFEPLFVALGAAAAVAYARAARGAEVAWWRIAAFALGIVLVVGALNSPLETIASHYLLLVHLLQNVMISDWAPPLLIIGLTPAMRAAVARRGGRVFAFVTRPQIALPIWLVGWYVIHLAAFYDTALRNVWLLNLEHVALVAIGLVFWWPVISDAPRALSAPVRIAYLGAGFVLSVFLGLGLTFAGSAFYDFYEGAPRLWGLDPVQDQNLGGVLMTGEQAIVFLAAIIWQLLRLLREEEEKEAQQREQDARLLAELDERERRI
jgi:cytochrome c oxidase assembly factor CtaG